jgi:predicted amidophosphoribosyltransferase
MTHIKSRITREKKIVELMIRLYCKRKERNRELCPACQDLLKYAHARLEHCPFGEKKSTCRLCTVHCYKPEMRQRMQSVMRYAGPRMLLYHPIAAIRHLMEETGHFFFTHTN